MGLFSGFKKGLSWGFAPSSWIGTEQMKSQAKICKDLAHGLMPNDKAQNKVGSTFNHSLTPEQVKQRKLTAIIFVAVYLILGLSALGYAWYLFFSKGFMLAGLVSIAIAALLFVYGLREGVLYAQLRLNRNRITLREFFKYLAKGFRP